MANPSRTKNENSIVTFTKRHKKELIIIAGTVGTILTGIGLSKIAGSLEPRKYSSKWFESVSDDVLKSEREIVRKQYCSSGNNFSMAVQLQNLLNRFDSVLSKRAWAGKIPQSPSYPREHGHNLYKPD